MKGKRYSEEFKKEAVKQVTDRCYSVAEVAERLAEGTPQAPAVVSFASPILGALQQQGLDVTEVAGEQLRAEAEADQRRLLGQRHRHPVGLVPQVVVAVIGAHRAAENDGAGMPCQRRRQRIAEPRAPDVEPVAAPLQVLTDPTGGGMLLMQDDQDRGQRFSPLHGGRPASA